MSMDSFLDNYTTSFYDMIVEYVDAEYSLWLSWFLMPVIVTFLLPTVLIVLIYLSSIIFHLYRLYRIRKEDGVNGDWKDAARWAVCALWDAHGWLYHGYEVRGIENITDKPCLIIYYHGALPIDMYYFIARLYLCKRIMLNTVADRFLFKIPGWKALLDGLCVIPGTVQTCAGVLRGGNSLAISPGGVYEAQFSDHTYKLKWKSRIGFAKVALDAKVPIVPMFTQNVREAFRTVGFLRSLWIRLYASTRIPFAPVYGGFPVKLITHLGKPIEYDPSLTPEQLQQKVASAIEAMIEEHQRIPGNIFLGLLERIRAIPKWNKKDKMSYLNCNGISIKENPEKSDSQGNLSPSEKFTQNEDLSQGENFTDSEYIVEAGNTAYADKLNVQYRSRTKSIDHGKTTDHVDSIDVEEKSKVS